MAIFNSYFDITRGYIRDHLFAAFHPPFNARATCPWSDSPAASSACGPPPPRPANRAPHPAAPRAARSARRCDPPGDPKSSLKSYWQENMHMYIQYVYDDVYVWCIYVWCIYVWCIYVWCIYVYWLVLLIVDIEQPKMSNHVVPSDSHGNGTPLI